MLQYGYVCTYSVSLNWTRTVTTCKFVVQPQIQSRNDSEREINSSSPRLDLSRLQSATCTSARNFRKLHISLRIMGKLNNVTSSSRHLGLATDGRPAATMGMARVLEASNTGEVSKFQPCLLLLRASTGRRCTWSRGSAHGAS